VGCGAWAALKPDDWVPDDGFWHHAPMAERPVDGILRAEAARILGCHAWTAGEYVKTGRLRSAGKFLHWALSRADVEALACQTYPWWDHLDDADSYWIIAKRARRILGVNHTRLNQLASEASSRSSCTSMAPACTAESSSR
jgi:hypothetical protein